MSVFEVAIWERHYITEQHAINSQMQITLQSGHAKFPALLNDVDPITDENVKNFRSRHNPCR
jgi:hypothetical protein